MRTLLACVLFASSLPAQSRGAEALHHAVNGITTTPRVLLVGVHPDDADSELIAWLARGRRVQTGYLSLTRGEGAPNFLGQGTGSSLGVIRTLESLAARRIDGGEQYFTRAYDFGYARTVDAVLSRWNRDSVVSDVVAVIRAFRPHVIVGDWFDFSPRLGDAMHPALGVILRDAFALAGDSTRFRALGDPWTPLKLYRPGGALAIDVTELDPLSGASYWALAQQARAQHRSQGLADVFTGVPGRRKLRLVATAAGLAHDSAETSLFDGVDTTLARLAADTSSELRTLIEAIATNADSAAAYLHAAAPGGVVPYLARVVRYATRARAIAPWCKHPVAVFNMPAGPPKPCDALALDLDASVDLMQRRAADALLAAAGVEVSQSADRELVAESDTATVSIRITNHGSIPITLDQVWVANGVDDAQPALRIDTAETVHLFKRITGLQDGRPWWLSAPGAGRYTEMPSGRGLDGILRPRLGIGPLGVPSVAVPEQIRRVSDVTLTFTIANAAFATSLGPVVFPYADPIVGAQRRPVSGITDVTMRLGRALEWIPANKPVTHTTRLGVQSFSDSRQTVALRYVTPPGVTMDSAPRSLTLDPREQRELFLRMRARMDTGEKRVFGIVASRPGHEPIAHGYQVIQHPELLPIRIARQSGLWLQPVEINVPKNLVAVYVPGVAEDVYMALKDVGVQVAVVGAEDFHAVDLKGVSTVVFGPRALEAHRELVAQIPRVLDFVRAGGTLVIQRGERFTVNSAALPYLAALASPLPERVVDPASPVTVIFPNARVLKWPNQIRASDWEGWVSGRATAMPTTADSKYIRILETHDPGEPENRNALLLAPFGKGTVVYSALTLDEQIAGGVPGALRLMVNLLSAGLAAPTSGPVSP